MGKEEIVKTPILTIFERVQRMMRPLGAAHKVEKQMNKICISKEKVKTCGGQFTGAGFAPGMTKQVEVKYACVASPSSKAESLKKRAMGGEALDFELNELPIAYTKMETEPMYCGGHASGSGSEGYGMGGGYGSGSGTSGSGIDGGYGSGSESNGNGMEGGYGSLRQCNPRRPSCRSNEVCKATRDARHMTKYFCCQRGNHICP